MRRPSLLLFATGLALALAASANAQQISGDYIETRSADVYVGPCVANGEVNLAGDQAILAWRIKKGAWDGVSLEGLSVVGIVKASATLGDVHSDPYPARAILVVDSRATESQQTALLGFARTMAGRLLDDVVSVERAPIEIRVSHDNGHYAATLVRAGDLAEIKTRAIGEGDHLCGNETAFYPPLAQMSHAMPAVAELDSFTGSGLGVSWTVSGKRSAFVGSFSR